MDLAYGLSVFESARGNFPDLPVVNMVAEDVPTEETVALISRPALETSDILMGSGPVTGLFQTNGVLDNALFAVSAASLYEEGTLIGDIDGSGIVSIDGYEAFLFVNAGQSLWSYDGTTLATIAFPDGASVIKCCIGASRLIAIREDTQTFYWTEPLGSTIDALSFASAENSPDRLLDMIFIGDTLVLFGSETVEFWPVTDDADLPFAPMPGRVFQAGIKQTGAVTRLGSTFAWVTERNQICLSDPENVVSNPGLESLIDGADSVVLWSFVLDGTEYLVAQLPTRTFVMNTRNKLWAEFTTYGETNWAAQCHTNGKFGSSIDGTVYQWSTSYEEFGGILERRFRAGIPVDEYGLTVGNLSLRTNPGRTPYLAGDYANPVVEMRFSRDGGATWSDWKSRLLGIQGAYRQKTEWKSVGVFGYPSFLAEFRVTDPVPFRVSGVKINQKYGR